MPILNIDIEARFAQALDSLKRLESESKKTANNISKAFGAVKTAFAAIGAGVSIAGFTALIKGAIDAQDHLNNLSKATGIAVEELGGLGFAAKQAGSSLDGMAAAVGKLNLSI